MGNSNISVPHWSVLEPFFSHQKSNTKIEQPWWPLSSLPSMRNLNWIDDDTRAPCYRSIVWDRYTVGRFSTAIVVGTHWFGTPWACLDECLSLARERIWVVKLFTVGLKNSVHQGNIDGVTTVQINHGDLIKATWKHLRPHGRKTDVAPNFRLLPP